MTVFLTKHSCVSMSVLLVYEKKQCVELKNIRKEGSSFSFFKTHLVSGSRLVFPIAATAYCL